MEKRALASSFLLMVISFIIILIILSNQVLADTNNSLTQTLVSAPSDSSGLVNKAYQCLQNEINSKSSDALSLQEAVFSSLALGYQQQLQTRISNAKDSNLYCWPNGACKIKDTAQVYLAYQRAGSSDTNNVLQWISSRNSTTIDLNWYLEIDISGHNASSCTLKYDSYSQNINILDNMQISGNPGPCMSISDSGYWLNVNPSCFSKPIQVSCNSDFITTLLYQRSSGGTVYVQPQTHSSAALGTTTEQINSQCFKSGSSCDYEGTLWATLALSKAGKDISAFIPYLLSLADDNSQYLPSSFLYIFTGGNDQFSKLIQNQVQGRYWSAVASPYNEFYDTSLAMLSLSTSSSTESDNAKNYLLNIQTNNSCWNNNNIRDTAFLLYAGWPQAVISSNGQTGSSSPLCDSVSTQECSIANNCLNAGGRILSNFACAGFGVCCSIKVPVKTCLQQQGTICAASQQCSGRIAQSSDSGVCCLDACAAKQQADQCTSSGGRCDSSCQSNEQTDSSNACSDVSKVCCVVKPTNASTGISTTWIVILVILIILIILAIIFRNKLKLFWYKFKGKASSSPVIRPGVPPSSSGFGLDARRFIPPGNRPAQMPAQQMKSLPKRMSEKDKELDDTLKKLKEMSK